MAIWLCMRWWYGAGWQWAVQRGIVVRLKWCNETFSTLALTRTLFAPFKQTFSQPGGSIDMRFHAFLDNIISRAVGFMARSFIILTGLIASLFVMASGLVFLMLWPLAPIALPVSVAMMILGVG